MTLPSSGSIEDLCQSIMSKPFKSQLYNLWIVTSLSILYEIWRTRNKAKHQGSLVSLHKFQVPIHIFFFFLSKTLCKFWEWYEHFPSSWASFFLEKSSENLTNGFPANSDSLSKVNPRISTCGAIFRTSSSSFLRCFAISLGLHTTFYAELVAMLNVIDITCSRNWLNLWIECDSPFVASNLVNRDTIILLGALEIVG